MRDLGRSVCLRCEVQLLAAARGRGPRPSTPRSYSSSSRARPVRTSANGPGPQVEDADLPTDPIEAASRRRAAAVAMFRSILGEQAQTPNTVAHRPPPLARAPRNETPKEESLAAPSAASVPPTKPAEPIVHDVESSSPPVSQVPTPSPVSNTVQTPEKAESAPISQAKETVAEKTKIETPKAPGWLKTLPSPVSSEKPEVVKETAPVPEAPETQEAVHGNDPDLSGSSIELFGDVSRLKRMMTVGGEYEAAFAFFEKTIYPQIKAQHGMPQVVKFEVAKEFLSYLAKAKIEHPDDPKLPSVVRITELTFELSSLYYIAWGTMVLSLVEHIIRQETTPDAFSTLQDYEAAMAKRDALMGDLLGAWDVFVEHNPGFLREVPRRNSAPTPATKKLHERVPGLDKSSTLGFTKLFISLSHDQLQRDSLRYNISWAAYATYRMLTDRINATKWMREESSTFTRMMKNVLTRAKPPSDRDLAYNFADYPDLLKYIRDLGEKDGNHIWYVPLQTPEQQRIQHRIDIHRRIGAALRKSNLQEVKAAWADFWGPNKNPDADRLKALTEDTALFDYFIQAFMQLRQTDLTNHVWESMHHVKIQPTIKTWSALMEGCSRARSKDALKKVWNNLITSDIKLDVHIWTSRVAGLFKAGDPEGGIRALIDMEKTWTTRDQNPLIAVQPSIEPVNAAIAGLFRLNRQEDVITILSWAGKQGINPDIVTFNILLRPLVLKGDIPGVRRLLSQMQDAGIEADAGTFTILFEGTMKNYADRSQEEQLAHVKRFVTEMEACGIGANMMTFAKIIKLLVDQGDTGKDTLKNVYGHILQSGLEPTPHIYTMLLEHFFSQSPPNTQAVTDLIRNRRLHQRGNVDRIFWERVISGYCQAGEIGKAIEVFAKEFEGKKEVGMTFGMLYDYLAGLCKAGEWEAAKRLVRRAWEMKEDLVVVDGKDGKGMRLEVVRKGNRGLVGDGGEGKVREMRFWRHRFWRLAEREGLLG